MTLARPVFLTTGALANALSLPRQSVLRACQRGRIKAVQVHLGARWYEPSRRTTRGRWLIPISEVRRLLEAAYCGEPVPPSILRAIERLARPLPK